jgi:hypothetical protein
MDVESYERLQDVLILLKLISQSEEALQKGRWLSQAQMENNCARGWQNEATSGSLVGAGLA